MAIDRGSHARHDRFAIAEAIGGGMTPGTIGTCPACGALHADLLGLQRALRESWLPSRPRDLRLTVAVALRLRRRSWGGWVALIGSTRDGITRPLALGFTALGLGGLLLTSTPAGALMGSSGAAPAEVVRPMGAAPTDHPLNDPGVAAAAVEDARAAAQTEPLFEFSIALLAIGGSIFVVRRLAPRTDAVR